jgi:hypothetical protein
MVFHHGCNLGLKTGDLGLPFIKRVFHKGSLCLSISKNNLFVGNETISTLPSLLPFLFSGLDKLLELIFNSCLVLLAFIFLFHREFFDLGSDHLEYTSCLFRLKLDFIAQLCSD